MPDSGQSHSSGPSCFTDQRFILLNFEAIFGSVNDGIITEDENMEMVEINAAAQQMFLNYLCAATNDIQPTLSGIA